MKGVVGQVVQEVATVYVVMSIVIFYLLHSIPVDGPEHELLQRYFRILTVVSMLYEG